MAIIDSVRKLAEKVGADTNGRTIADQLNIINEKLDNTQLGSRDIAEAVSKFADKEDGTAILITKTITENNTYKASDDSASGYSSVTVNVANSYASDDNGKVVSNQELVAQTAYPTEITENDTYDTTNYNSITVNVPSGGGGSSGNDVIFYDYDGSVVASYSAADFATLTAMPTNPTHVGLTAQGWNWSLADAKAYVASYGKLNIGQMYITSDGKTRFYFIVDSDSSTVELYQTVVEGTELDVDWGDGSAHTTWTYNDGDSYKSHEYATAGRYTMAIEVVSGSFELVGVDNLYKVEIGSNVSEISEGIYQDCDQLNSITIPNSVTSIGNYAFQNCLALKSITIPNSVTSIGFNTFYGCSALLSVTIPDGVTSLGYNAFYCCYALSSITIPDSVTSIGTYVFQNCYSLSSVTIPDSVTSIGDSAFYDCYALSSSITIPDGVTSISDNAFSDCHSLSSVTIPVGVISIGDSAFIYCSSLSSITIPDSVTSIGESAFNYCYALSSVTFESSNPPSLDDNLGLPYTCIIRVPQGSLSAYTSASNYPDSSTYIYEEY